MRETLSNFVTHVTFLYIYSWDWKELYNDEKLIQKLEETCLLEQKVKLLIDPNDEDQKRLAELLEISRLAVTKNIRNAKENRSPEKWNDLRDELMPLSNKILDKQQELVNKRKA